MRALIIICFFFLFASQGFCLQPQALADSLEFSLQKHPDIEVFSGNEFFGSSHLLTASRLQPVSLNNSPVNDWFTIIILVSVLSIALARFFFPSRMNQYFKAAFATRFFNQMEREGNFFNETLTYLLLFNYFTVISLLTAQTYILFSDKLILPFEVMPYMVFITAFGALTGFYFSKSIITRSIAWIFKTQYTNNIYLKNIHLYNQIIGILLLPIIAFSAYNYSLTGIFIAWGLVLTGGLFKVSRNIFMGRTLGGFPMYYIILYLCAVELVPILILVKAASGYLLAG
jgi:hypothetical protein